MTNKDINALKERVALLDELIACFKWDDRYHSKEQMILTLEAFKEEYEATLKD